MDKLLRQHLSKLGRKGGRSKSPAKLEALARARKILAANRRAAKKGR